MKVDHILEGKRLKDHVIRSVDAIDADGCEVLCFWEPDCVSFNFKKSLSQKKNKKISWRQTMIIFIEELR